MISLALIATLHNPCPSFLRREREDSEDCRPVPPRPVSAPGPLPVAGVAAAWWFSRRLRQRIREGRP